jgi:hypothetical protein
VTRTPAVALALLAALALPRPSRAALEWTARAGLDYQRTTTEGPATPATTVPRLDVDLALDLSGSAPGVLDLGGGVQYRRTAVTQSSVDAVRDQLSYRLRSTIFSNPRSPITVTGHATRVEDDFSTDGAAAGSLRSTVYGGDFTLNGVTRPRLTAGYTFSDLDQASPLVGPSERTVHTVNAAAGHGTATYTIGTRYRGSFAEGTYAFDNFDDHRVDVDADVDLTRDFKLRLTDTYYLRHPTTESPFNPRQELNSLSAVLTRLGERGDNQTASYSYAHGLQSALDSEDQERSQHRLTYALLRVLPDPEWRIRGQVDVAFTEDRLGDATRRASGQSLGGTLFWRRQRGSNVFEVRGGPTVGVLEPDGQDAVLGYGGTAGLTYVRQAAIVTQTGYELSYGSDLQGIPGWTLRQQAYGSAEGRLGHGLLRGSLQASADRRDNDLFGSGASRALSAALGYRVARGDLRLDAGVQDGLVGAAPGDGLFLAPPFDSHVRFATLSGSYGLFRYVTVRAHLRRTSRDLPDRPPLGEQEAYASLELAYGALRFAVEDKYVAAEVPTGELRVNQVFFRVSRVLGTRY